MSTSRADGCVTHQVILSCALILCGLTLLSIPGCKTIEWVQLPTDPPPDFASRNIRKIKVYLTVDFVNIGSVQYVDETASPVISRPWPLRSNTSDAAQPRDPAAELLVGAPERKAGSVAGGAEKSTRVAVYQYHLVPENASSAAGSPEESMLRRSITDVLARKGYELEVVSYPKDGGENDIRRLERMRNWARQNPPPGDAGGAIHIYVGVAYYQYVYPAEPVLDLLFPFYYLIDTARKETILSAGPYHPKYFGNFNFRKQKCINVKNYLTGIILEKIKCDYFETEQEFVNRVAEELFLNLPGRVTDSRGEPLRPGSGGTSRHPPGSSKG